MRAAAVICSLLWVALNAASLAPPAFSRKSLPDQQINTESKQGTSHIVASLSFQTGEIGLGGKDLKGDKSVSRGLKLMGRIGSRPPSCTNRCGRCAPCDATQIPASTDRKTVDYTNYEPEGWKCKCGSHFFDP
ncbi:hypothetical protein MLD38_005832 [Melastoma candidum]|uniref:Uncharacterized protein n=1 Tax=Melastoma candidum TaxID=119954 RepID=A0ACB9RNZ0_9MYRT|nr:hypothetical protein MLD38_005832 [Melastoma candidum]